MMSVLFFDHWSMVDSGSAATDFNILTKSESSSRVADKSCSKVEFFSKGGSSTVSRPRCKAT